MTKGLFRKQLILPAEHGSWAWFLVPYLAGAVVAGAGDTGRFDPAVLLVLLGGLSAFLMRQPATRWLRIRQGKGRRSEEPLAAGWTLFLGAVAFLSLVLLLLLGVWSLLWLLPPLGVILAIYIWLALRPGSSVRTLYMELAGAAGLAAAAPAAYMAGTRQVDSVVAWLWLLFAAQNMLGALYVRQRIADTHQRPLDRRRVLLVHLIVLFLVVAAVLAGWLNGIVLVPFVAFALRAEWVARRARPVANIKQFGFTEVGIELLGGFFFVLAYV